MTDYLTDFVQESEERITELNNALLTLEREPDDEEAMENIFRIAHTLKGNCGAMGLDSASDLAHAIEDLLDAVRRDDLEVTSELMDAVFDAVDELETMIDEVAATGEIETDPSATIRALRAQLDRADEAAGFAAPTADEIDDVCSRFDPPEDDDHDVYLVRLDIAEREGVNNGKLVVDALIDAFDLIGTAPSQERLEAAEYDGRFDAVFGTAVGEAAITSGLEPVEEVDEFEIVDVSDRFEEADETDQPSQPVDDPEPGEGISAEEAQDLEVDDLLDEFTEFDDLDEMVEDVDDDDLAAFEDMGEAGSFDDLLAEQDVDIDDEPGEPPAEALDEADTDASEQGSTADAGSDTDDVDDASAVFNELKDEVEMVGFDELQDELAELEFDEFDDEEEVGMDELLGEDADDDSFLEGDAPSESEVDDILVDDDVEADDIEADESAEIESTVEPTESDASDDGTADNGDHVVDATDDAADSTATQAPETERVDDDSDASEADVDSDDSADATDDSDLEQVDTGDETDDSDLEEPAVDADTEGDDAEEPSDGGVDDEPAADDETGGDDDRSTATDDVAPTDADPGEETEAIESPAEDGAETDSAAEPVESDAPETDDASVQAADPAAPSDDAADDVDLETEAVETAEDDESGTVDSFGDDADDVEPTAAFGDFGSADAETEAFDDGFESADDGFDDDLDDEFDDDLDDEFDDGFDDDFDEELDDEVFAGTDEFDVGAAGFDSPTPDSDATDATAESAAFGDDPTDDGTDADDDIERTIEEPTLEIPELTVPETDEQADDDESQPGEVQSVRVDVEQIDSLLTLVEGLVTSRVRLRHAAEAEAEGNDALETELDALSELTTDLQETVMDIRLVPLQTVTNRLPRVVRDIARDQDKEVAFEMHGETVELDRSILDRIGDPLIHLVRNAVDHGIESPEAREQADKSPEGTVEVHADRARDRVTISVEDDGSGLDPDRLRAEAVDAEVITESEAAELSDEDAYELIFHPGLSTVDEVTDISGRGVGMDVVKRTIEDLDGTVSIDSEPSEGTTVTMELPVTVAIDEILFVESGGEEFGVPTKAVRDIESASALESTGEHSVLPSEDGDYPVIPLADVLETPAPGANGDGMVVRIRGEVREVALHCDRVHGQQEVVVKPFEGFMSGVPGLSGATVRGRGEVVNILDVTTL
ncbi:Hpt domain-containing protein [Natrinema marinum]|uniref:Hpt domain-containing protein n=1 Tax=Natrinema marinum TaxID=2961598 RepID=UPI0020C85D8C|nr:Hpt domain-containing protein [Natrinema marinum]